MMRLSQRVVLYRIIGMPFVHFALFLHALYRCLYVFSKQVWNLLFFMMEPLGFKQWSLV